MGDRTLDKEGALAKMRGLLFGFSITRSIAVAAELGIADRLADGPRTATDLARECGVLERPLYRMLRALAGEGVFAENNDGRFALTPLGRVAALRRSQIAARLGHRLGGSSVSSLGGNAA